MGTFKVSYLFDSGVVKSMTITHDTASDKWTCAIKLSGAADGYGVYSSGATPDIAVQRALECTEHAERWRKLKF
jgi:hypothetical protein